MKLFNDIELFDGGVKEYKDFKLPDTNLRLWQHLFNKTDADQYFKILHSTPPWQQRSRKMYDKIVSDPRLAAFYCLSASSITD